MVPSEGGLELIPADNMVGRQHGVVVAPPKPGGTMQLLSCEPDLVLVGERGGEEFEFGFDRANPCVGIERVLYLVEGQQLRAQKVFIASNLRLLMSPPSMGLLLLPLDNVPW